MAVELLDMKNLYYHLSNNYKISNGKAKAVDNGQGSALVGS